MSSTHCHRAGRFIPLLLLALSTSSPAATALADFVDAALAREPGDRLVSAESAVGDALQRKADQVLADAPTANIKYQTDRIGDDLGYREWEGGVELPLWLPGQADTFAREAGSRQGLAQTMAATRRLAVAGEVRERLWAAALAQGEAAQAKSAQAAARELYDDIQRRVTAGELPRSDSLLAEKELLQREDAAQQAYSRALQAARLFTRYTGAQPPAAPDAEPVAQTDRLDAQHPELLLAAQEVELARAHRDRVSATRHSGPSLWLGGKTARATAGGSYESALGVELSMPFGAGAHSAPELAEAEAALTRAEVELEQTRLRLQDNLTRASLEQAGAAAALARTERRRALSEQALQLSRRAFELGETDLVRLLQAQADALAARQDHQIRTLQHGQAVARLNQAAGVIPQ